MDPWRGKVGAGPCARILKGPVFATQASSGPLPQSDGPSSTAYCEIRFLQQLKTLVFVSQKEPLICKCGAENSIGRKESEAVGKSSSLKFRTNFPGTARHTSINKTTSESSSWPDEATSAPR